MQAAYVQGYGGWTALWVELDGASSQPRWLGQTQAVAMFMFMYGLGFASQETRPQEEPKEHQTSSPLMSAACNSVSNMTFSNSLNPMHVKEHGPDALLVPGKADGQCSKAPAAGYWCCPKLAAPRSVRSETVS